jgi:hypothetical protein
MNAANKLSASASTASALIELAATHEFNGATMGSSARQCLADARELLAAGKAEYAARWAVSSLDYSVGCFHPDRRRAGELLGCGDRSAFNTNFIRGRV